MALSSPTPSAGTALAGHLRHRALRWFVLAALLLTLTLLIVQPLGWIVYNSFHDDDTGLWSLGNYRQIFASVALLKPLLNSLLLATAVAVLSTLLGVPLAWLVSRTDLPGRGLIRVLTLAAFVTPSFIGALGWILLAAPNSGWLNVGWRALTGAQGPLLNIYTMAGTIFVCAIYTVPYTFTMVSSALDEMAVELEDAATTLGSGVVRTMISVTIPLVMPAVLVSFILSFIQGMTLFGVPAFLLTPSGTLVVTTKLAEFYQLFPPALFLSAAYCMPLIVITGGLFYARRRILGRRQFVTVGGKGRAGRLIRLKSWRLPALLFALIVPVAAVLLPYVVIILVSLSKAWGLGPVPGNLTFHWYRWAITENAETQRAIVNSLLYAGVAASFCMLLGILVAYIVERRLLRGASLLAALVAIPIVIPGIVLSVGFFSAYARPPLNFYGTGAIVIAAFVATFVPIAYAQAGSILKGIGPELERAARSVGASEARTLATITIPLMRGGLAAGWLLVFIPIMRELSVAIFLVSPKTNVMTTLIYNYKDGGNYEAVCAASALLLAGTLLIVLLARFVTEGAARRRRNAASLGAAA
ncbi:ABC transporter permease [Bosea sp. (in: a-proteobacteria)]|jgi:iron(III) transport system permease protein|uniref:ABC transporter permease n=1 Tax=Bosea sp. (in: a-proteobacteria) TaxID=1871050 RepID=UPI003F712FBD